MRYSALRWALARSGGDCGGSGSSGEGGRREEEEGEEEEEEEGMRCGRFWTSVSLCGPPEVMFWFVRVWRGRL